MEKRFVALDCRGRSRASAIIADLYRRIKPQIITEEHQRRGRKGSDLKAATGGHSQSTRSRPAKSSLTEWAPLLHKDATKRRLVHSEPSDGGNRTAVKREETEMERLCG